MLLHVSWKKKKEMAIALIMEAVRTSETSIRLHRATSAKAAIFIFVAVRT